MLFRTRRNNNTSQGKQTTNKYWMGSMVQREMVIRMEYITQTYNTKYRL